MTDSLVSMSPFNLSPSAPSTPSVSMPSFSRRDGLDVDAAMPFSQPGPTQPARSGSHSGPFSGASKAMESCFIVCSLTI